MSYGGSALLPTMLALGLLLALARHEPGPAPLSLRVAPDADAGGGGQQRRRVVAGLIVHVVLAGGGTAGHVEPALALADALRRQDPDVEITALGTERGLERDSCPRAARPRADPPVPLPRRITPALLTVPSRLAGSVAPYAPS